MWAWQGRSLERVCGRREKVWAIETSYRSPSIGGSRGWSSVVLALIPRRSPSVNGAERQRSQGKLMRYLMLVIAVIALIPALAVGADSDR